MDQGYGEEIEWLHEFVEFVRQVHEQVLKVGGGAHGERTASLIAACARPFHTFEGQSLYEDPFLRASALFHGLICDHPFADGNKRTATFAAISLSWQWNTPCPSP